MLLRLLPALAMAGMLCCGLTGCSGDDNRKAETTEQLKPRPAPNMEGGNAAGSSTTGKQQPKTSSGIQVQ